MTQGLFMYSNIQNNRQFNVRCLTNESGGMVQLYAYTPYGKRTAMKANGTLVTNLDNLKTNYGFTGRYYDQETNLWYFRARYFSNELGRFISRDPLGYVDGMSLYTGYFASGFRKDPYGLSDESYMDYDYTPYCNSRRCDSERPENPICCEKWEYMWEFSGYPTGSDCEAAIMGGSFLSSVGNLTISTAAGHVLAEAGLGGAGYGAGVFGYAVTHRIARDLCGSSICSKPSKANCSCTTPGWIWDTWKCSCSKGGIANGLMMMPRPGFPHPSTSQKFRNYWQRRN